MTLDQAVTCELSELRVEISDIESGWPEPPLAAHLSDLKDILEEREGQ